MRFCFSDFQVEINNAYQILTYKVAIGSFLKCLKNVFDHKPTPAARVSLLHGSDFVLATNVHTEEKP